MEIIISFNIRKKLSILFNIYIKLFFYIKIKVENLNYPNNFIIITNNIV